jgi:vacuolar protein sorting-associated protein 13A/C
VTLNDESNELTLFKTISSLGLSISTFENAPIILNALKIKNIFGDKEEVAE